MKAIIKTGYGGSKYVEAQESCCPEMFGALHENAIASGSSADGMQDRVDELQLAIIKVSAWPEGAYATGHAIKFCPFCGEKIEVEA